MGRKLLGFSGMGRDEETHSWGGKADRSYILAQRYILRVMSKEWSCILSVGVERLDYSIRKRKVLHSNEWEERC